MKITLHTVITLNNQKGIVLGVENINKIWPFFYETNLNFEYEMR